MEKSQSNSILVITNKEDDQKIIVEELELQKYRVIKATSSNEARLKYSNESFRMTIMDMDLTGFSAKDFINSIRRKEDHKNLKDRMTILVIGSEASLFQKKYADFDNVKFLETPFASKELKKKLLLFTEHASIISENAKLIKQGEYLVTEGGAGQEMF